MLLWLIKNKGAPGRSRTHNLLIRSQALYPLSYWGVSAIIPDNEHAGVESLFTPIYSVTDGRKWIGCVHANERFTALDEFKSA